MELYKLYFTWNKQYCISANSVALIRKKIDFRSELILSEDEAEINHVIYLSFVDLTWFSFFFTFIKATETEEQLSVKLE